jgi:hypothetical protein
MELAAPSAQGVVRQFEARLRNATFTEDQSKIGLGLDVSSEERPVAATESISERVELVIKPPHEIKMAVRHSAAVVLRGTLRRQKCVRRMLHKKDLQLTYFITVARTYTNWIRS